MPGLILGLLVLTAANGTMLAWVASQPMPTDTRQVVLQSPHSADQGPQNVRMSLEPDAAEAQRTTQSIAALDEMLAQRLSQENQAAGLPPRQGMPSADLRAQARAATDPADPAVQALFLGYKDQLQGHHAPEAP